MGFGFWVLGIGVWGLGIGVWGLHSVVGGLRALRICNPLPPQLLRNRNGELISLRTPQVSWDFWAVRTISELSGFWEVQAYRS